jgi:hypothetical protein
MDRRAGCEQAATDEASCGSLSDWFEGRRITNRGVDFGGGFCTFEHVFDVLDREAATIWVDALEQRLFAVESDIGLLRSTSTSSATQKPEKQHGLGIRNRRSP